MPLRREPRSRVVKCFASQSTSKTVLSRWTGVELCRISRTPVARIRRDRKTWREQKDQISGSRRSQPVNLCFLACVAVSLRNKRTRLGKCNHRHCVRAAKEMDSKSIGLCPQGFESPRCRYYNIASALSSVISPDFPVSYHPFCPCWKTVVQDDAQAIGLLPTQSHVPRRPNTSAAARCSNPKPAATTSSSSLCHCISLRSHNWPQCIRLRARS